MTDPTYPDVRDMPDEVLTATIQVAQIFLRCEASKVVEARLAEMQAELRRRLAPSRCTSHHERDPGGWLRAKLAPRGFGRGPSLDEIEGALR
jgi:hypothetical protein